MTSAVALAPLRLERAQGALTLAFGQTSRGTEIARLGQSGCLRMRLPRGPRDGFLEGVCLNMAGGLAAGDMLRIEAHCLEGAHARLTSAAAEKVYRAPDGLAEVAVTLRADAGAALEWMPQETILFDNARLRRRLEVEMHHTASLLAVEAVVLGRTARHERVVHGLVEEAWTVRRGGHLVFADRLRLGGPVDALSRRPAVLDGALAFATVLLVDPRAEGRLDAVRAALDGGPEGESIGGASAWDGLCVVRLAGQDGAALRRALTRVLGPLRDRALPHVWTL